MEESARCERSTAYYGNKLFGLFKESLTNKVTRHANFKIVIFSLHWYSSNTNSHKEMILPRRVFKVLCNMDK